jgi:hypothetical protein
MLARRPDVLTGLTYFVSPIKDDTDASLVATLHAQGLLPEEIREFFVERVANAATEQADASFLDVRALGAVLTEEEKDSILDTVESQVIVRVDRHIDRLRYDWDKEAPPEDYFDDFQRSLKLFVEALSDKNDH